LAKTIIGITIGKIINSKTDLFIEGERAIAAQKAQISLKNSDTKIELNNIL